jgi:hypothetical protein
MAQANPQGLTSTDVESEYDPNVIRRIIESMRQTSILSYQRDRDVDIVGAPDSAGRRPHLVLRSPDGSLYRVLVDDVGVLSTEAAPVDRSVSAPLGPLV